MWGVACMTGALAGRKRYSPWLIKHLSRRLCGGLLWWVQDGLISHLIYCGAVFVVLRCWHFGCLKRHHSLHSKSAMGLKFTITGLVFQALLIILFSVLVDYSDHALPSHSRKGASGNVNVTTETLPVNDVSVYYPSKIVCFTCNSCFIRLRIRSIPSSPGFYFEC